MSKKEYIADKVDKRPIDVLIPYARNSRTHSAAQVAQIAASIREFGFTNPVLTDYDGGIIAGHGRVLAAHKLGMAEVPCITLGWLSETQKRAYVIADNKLALNGGWDEEMLALELEDLKVLDFDLDLLGFEPGELSELLSLGDEAPDDRQSSAKEIDTDTYQLAHRCPRCSFEFNDDKA